MTDILLFHGFNINGSGIWYPWLKEQLELNGDFVVRIPDLPNAEDPILVEWLESLNEEMFGTDSTRPLIIIGHSLGGYFVQRVLESVVHDTRNFWKGRLVAVYLVAATGFPIKRVQNFYNPKLDWDKINANTENVQFHIVWDEEDYLVSKEHGLFIHKHCKNSKLHFLNNGNNHFLENTNQDLLQIILQNHTKQEK
ncbi:hypothetical protein M0812_04352 [Anaeramoeba flamelloides]|uniref:Uncharacterized protein n=1 Tax=Anaeramoeba flamelloides TaxID=1746091 RepID=A0AAV8AI25_9EUKA|nr:hypothetical protein M0812_04352 [Anaeramoeba flamelloides]